MFRNMLIVSTSILLLVGCTPKVDQKKYENLHRAAKAIAGAIAVGVNYQKFGELLQNLSTEISIANDKAKSDTEKELLKEYLNVLITYHESATIWKYKIEGARYEFIPSGRVYVKSELQSIISKYSLPTESHVTRIIGYKFETISENAIQLIWGKAHERLEKATKLYFGQ